MKEIAHPTAVTWPCHHPSLNHKSYSEGPAAGERLYLDPGCWWVFCSFQGKLLKVFLSWHSKGKRSLFKGKRLFQKEMWKEHKIAGLPSSEGEEHCGCQCEKKPSPCRDDGGSGSAAWLPRLWYEGRGPPVESDSPESESSPCCKVLPRSISKVRFLWLMWNRNNDACLSGWLRGLDDIMYTKHLAWHVACN